MVDGVARPRRWLAILLAAVGPAGVGHYYAGFKRRGVSWFAAQNALTIVTFAGLVGLGSSANAAACALVVLVAIAVRIAPLGDMALLKPERFRPVPWKAVALAAVASLVLTWTVTRTIRSRVVEAFKIPSAAMLPSLAPGDHVFVDKTKRDPARGEAIVFTYPDPDPAAAPLDFVKRVVAIAGDRVEFEADLPIINGWHVPTCVVGRHLLDDGSGAKPGEFRVEFLGERPYLIWLDDVPYSGKQGPFVVAPGEVWVLGDNRRNSSDSRAWRDGQGAGVPLANVKGRLLVVWFALTPDAQIDWSRIGTNLLEPPRLPAAPGELVRGLERCLASPPAQTMPPAPPR
jgi:signal peptidase I